MPKRSLQSILNRSLNERRVTESDVKFRLYVRPFGNRGLHVVKRSADGNEYIVTGPARTYRPGSILPTGSHTGTQGEFIIDGGPLSGDVEPERWVENKGYDTNGNGG